MNKLFLVVIGSPEWEVPHDISPIISAKCLNHAKEILFTFLNNTETPPTSLPDHPDQLPNDFFTELDVSKTGVLSYVYAKNLGWTNSNVLMSYIGNYSNLTSRDYKDFENGELGVRCISYSDAVSFTGILHKRGYKLANGTSLLDDTGWTEYKEHTVYVVSKKQIVITHNWYYHEKPVINF